MEPTVYVPEKGRKLFPGSPWITSRTKASTLGLAFLPVQLQPEFSPGCSICACSLIFQGVSVFEGVLPKMYPNCLPDRFFFSFLITTIIGDNVLVMSEPQTQRHKLSGEGEKYMEKHQS